MSAPLLERARRRFRGLFQHDETGRTTELFIEVESLLAAETAMDEQSARLGPRWHLVETREIERGGPLGG